MKGRGSKHTHSVSLPLVTSMPQCEATVVGEGQFTLGSDGMVVVQGDMVQRGRYCLDRGKLRLCVEEGEEGRR